MVQEDEDLTGELLDYFTETLLPEDDGTGPRLLWAFERLQWDVYKLMDSKKQSFNAINTRDSKQKSLKPKDLESILLFETSLISKYYPDVEESEIKEALSIIGDPFFIMSILSLLKFNMIGKVPAKPISTEKFEWSEDLVYHYHYKYFEKSNYKLSTQFFLEKREKIIDLELQYKIT